MAFLFTASIDTLVPAGISSGIRPLPPGNMKTLATSLPGAPNASCNNEPELSNTSISETAVVTEFHICKYAEVVTGVIV